MTGLANTFAEHIADEPETIANLQNRILDLGGELNFTVQAADIGNDYRTALEKDYRLQENVRPALNELVDKMQTLGDATSRRLIEDIFADEEEHLTWLEQELGLLNCLGEQLSFAKRA